MDIDFIEIFGLHALVSVIPGLLGAILGLVIGRPVARLLSGARGDGMLVSTTRLLVPWRAVIVLALVILLPSPYASILFGLGIPPAMMTVFLSAAVLALGIVLHGSTLVTHGNATLAALPAIVRTVIVASVGFGVVTHEFGSGSAGFLVEQGMRHFEHEVMWTGYAIVGILAILVDVAAGLAEPLLIRRANAKVAAR